MLAAVDARAQARARTERWHCTRLVAGRAGTAPLATTIEVSQRFVRIVSSDICFIANVIYNFKSEMYSLHNVGYLFTYYCT